MKEQKVTGNICPHIKRAIQECLKIKKAEIDELWVKGLTTTSGSEQQMKSVKDCIDVYTSVMNELVSAYALYSESVKQIVDVWKPMLNGSHSLERTFNLLIMTEFEENIWSDKNIKVIIEEIQKNKELFTNYNSNLDTISETLEKIKIPYTKTDSNENSTDCSSCSDDGYYKTHNCNKKKQRKEKKKKTKEPKREKSKKPKPVLINGKEPNEMDTEDLINYINGSKSNQKSGHQQKMKKKGKKRNNDIDM